MMLNFIYRDSHTPSFGIKSFGLLIKAKTYKWLNNQLNLPQTLLIHITYFAEG